MKKENPHDAFNRHGGRLTRKQFAAYVDRVSLQPWEREYVKRVMERYDVQHNRYISREDFFDGLDEMVKNQKDPISKAEVERIKKEFL